MRRFTLFAFLAVAPACSFQVPVEATTAGAVMVMPNRVSNMPIQLSLLVQGSTGTSIIRATGIDCTENVYQLSLNESVHTSLRISTSAAFPAMQVSQNAETHSGQVRRIIIQFERPTARLSFLPGLWQYTALANVEVAANVTVVASSGQEMYRGFIIGTGSEETPGYCPAGAQALGAAASNAIRRLAQDYVSKIINSGVVQ